MYPQHPPPHLLLHVHTVFNSYAHRPQCRCFQIYSNSEQNNSVAASALRQPTTTNTKPPTNPVDVDAATMAKRTPSLPSESINTNFSGTYAIACNTRRRVVGLRRGGVLRIYLLFGQQNGLHILRAKERHVLVRHTHTHIHTITPNTLATQWGERRLHCKHHANTNASEIKFYMTLAKRLRVQTKIIIIHSADIIELRENSNEIAINSSAFSEIRTGVRTKPITIKAWS